MINQLLDAISIKLSSVFPDAFIYTNKASQNFKPPAFFINCLKTEEVKMLSNRYKVTSHFEISYFNNQDTYIIEQNNSILQQFLDNFELLYFKGSFLRSRNLSFCMESSILKISLQYSFYINKDSGNSEKMKNLFY